MLGIFKKPAMPFVSAVVLAFDDYPLTIRAAMAFEQCRRVGEIVLVCAQHHIAMYYDLIREHGLTKMSNVVCGGDSRQDSVFRGVKAASEQARYYAIHDEPRPLVSPGDIEQCVNDAMTHGAAALGVPVKDTVKICDQNGFIVSTPDRAGLFTVQAPRIFEANLYRQAMAMAKNEQKIYDDDGKMIERVGVRVFITPGSYHNIQVSTPEDMALAEAILRFQEEGTPYWHQSV